SIFDLVVELVHATVELVELLFLSVRLLALHGLELGLEVLRALLRIAAFLLRLLEDVKRDRLVLLVVLFLFFLFLFFLFLFLFFRSVVFLGGLLPGRLLGRFGLLFFLFLLLVDDLVAAIGQRVRAVFGREFLRVRGCLLASHHFFL